MLSSTSVLITHGPRRGPKLRDGLQWSRRGLQDVTAAIVRWAEIRLVHSSPPRERRILSIALVILVVGTWIAYRQLPSAVTLQWHLIALAVLVGVPLTIGFNAAEYATSGAVVGYRVAPREALQISVLGSAANLLPLPGAALVRVRGLRRRGSGYGRAAMSTSIIGLAWLGTAALVAGAFQLLGDLSRGVGAVLVGAGLLAWLMASSLLAHKSSRSALPIGLRIMAIELGAVLISTLRLYLVLEALGIGTSFWQAAVLTVSAALASAVGFFPAGLGLRELISSVLGPLASIPAASAFLATAVDRLLDLAVLLPLALLLVMSGRGFDEVASVTPTIDEGERTA